MIVLPCGVPIDKFISTFISLTDTHYSLLNQLHRISGSFINQRVKEKL